MRKITSTILATVAFTVFSSSGTALFRAQNLAVSAQTPAEITAELVAPSSYEQYLQLNAPCDVAVCSQSTAIADGNMIYVLDRTDSIYRTYEHTAPIQNVAFDGNGNLYFLSELYLYRLTLENLKNGDEATPLNIACKGLFAIDGDTLCYYASNNALKFYSLSNSVEIREVSLENTLQSESPLAFGKNSLYCVCESKIDKNTYTVYAINLQTYGITTITNVNEKLLSLTLANNLLCFITESENFYSYNLNDLSASERADEIAPITKDEGGYVFLSSFGADVYAIRNNIVRHYSAAEKEAAFTDYEIGASSSSPHRFNGATEIALNNNRLFIADEQNGRISVYDTDTGDFKESIQTDIPVDYLDSYQNTLFVASQSETIVYSLSSRTYGEELLRMESENIRGDIVGVASVYGRYYALTEDNYCYMISKESGEWAWEETHKNTQTLRAMTFTADVYGSLYVAYDNDAVYRFTEKQLLSADESGEKILDGLQFPEKIAVDYATNLYALADGTLLKYSQNEQGMYALSTSYTPSYGLVKDETPRIQSFTFGLDTEFTYLLYEGDYIVKTDEMQIPKVSPIPVGNAADLIFGESNADFDAVTIEIDSILIEFDVSLLQEAVEFPYVAFERTQSVQTALKIGEEGEYSILAVAKERTGDYKTCLVLTSSCKALAPAEYRTDYAEAQEGYLTNDVSLYKFPYLNEVLTTGILSRGTEVSVVGEVIKLDHAYYKIQFLDENGNVQTGFVPKTYVTAFNGSTPSPETVIAGATETDTDAIWRCTFLILGFGAIIILVDFLILHKPKETEE